MSRRRSSDVTGKTKRFRIVNTSLLIIYILLISLLIFYIFRYNILAFRYLNIISTVLMIAVAVLSALFIWFNKARVFTTVLLVLSLLIGSGAIYTIKGVVDLYLGLNSTSNFSEYEMSVVVAADSDIKDIQKVTNVLAPTNNDGENRSGCL